MVLLWEVMRDLVRAEQGWWNKYEDGVWRFVLLEDRISKGIRLREGEGIESVKKKVYQELNIDERVESIELTYEMPEWMDVDGLVKPVPIHIKSDDDMDLFMAMRVDLHELKLYVIPLPKNMTLDINGFAVVPVEHEYADAEVVRLGEEGPSRQGMRADSRCEKIICSQPKEITEGCSRKLSKAVQEKESHIRTAKAINSAREMHARKKQVVSGSGSGGTNESADTSSPNGGVSPDGPLKTRNLFPLFNAVAQAEPDVETVPAKGVDKGKRVCGEGSGAGGHVEDLPPSAFARDAAPVFDDEDRDVTEVTENVILDVAYEGDDLFVGRVFKNKRDCKVKIAVHAINRRFSYKAERSSSDYVIVRCLADTCPWRVYVSRMEQTEYFQIRTATFNHTCPVDVRRQFHRQATTSVISEIMRDKYVGDNRGPNPVAVMRAMLDEHNVNISYWKAWRARELAMESAIGTASGSYGLLPSYLHLLVLSNPGTVSSLETETDGDGGQRFKYCFMALGASVRGVKYMTKVVIVDGTHLTGRFAGCLLTASAQDGNMQIFPIAFAVVDSENDKAWKWFFNQLKRIVPDSEDLTFVSDRHSSIYIGLGETYLKSNHGACIVHLQRNVSAKFKVKLLAQMISKAARAYRKSSFYEYFGEIERVSPDCAEYLTSIGFHHWTRSHSFGERYNIMTSNVAESLNAVLKEARELPIVSLMEFIRGTLRAWFSKRREKAINHTSPLTPKVGDLIQANYERSQTLNVQKINDFNFEVKTRTGLIYHVDCFEKTCTCDEFTLLKIPCCHALGAAGQAKVKVENLVADEYKTDFWRKAYSESINPVPDMSNLHAIMAEIATLTILPPKTRRPPGRPKRSRFLSTGEFKTRAKRASRSCTRCRGARHNRASCKMPI